MQADIRSDLITGGIVVTFALLVLLRGSGISDHLTELAALAVFTLVGFVAATRLFTKQL